MVKIPRIIRSMIIRDLKGVAPRLDIRMPPNPLEDCINTVMLSARSDHLESVLLKEIPNVRVLLVPLPPNFLQRFAHPHLPKEKAVLPAIILVSSPTRRR